MSAMYTTTALAAINERLQGNDPENNDELQIEIVCFIYTFFLIKFISHIFRSG